MSCANIRARHHKPISGITKRVDNMNIKIESGANVQITDKPIVNVYGDVVQHKEVIIHPENKGLDAEEAVIVGEEKGTGCKTRQDSRVDMNSSPNDNNNTLSANRQAILDQLLDLADKGDRVNGITSETVKAMMKAVLGVAVNLSAKEAELSEVLWHLLESGRGDRVKIVWQNMVGYMDDKKLFKLKGSPALNKDFFGDDKGYTNIDKGRPSKGLMTADFESIIPLLDAYCPKK